MGSSPRMRGTPAIHIVTEVLFGIIPAYAGNTSDINTCTFTGRDHPRVCGEHHWSTSWLCRRSGSSPRMRGTRCRRTVRGSRARIIPAYAGNTSLIPTESASSRDHPRVCGEHEVSFPSSSNMPGSSPRMRGTHRLETPCVQSDGIIPAYAGNTNLCPSMASMLRDHPRVCGEHGMADIGDAFNSGSSPRMRGTPNGMRRNAIGCGIIPAYAGNTSPVLRRCFWPRDHPRVCGEHPMRWGMPVTSAGSSPRMRGTPSDALHLGLGEGIIPAYAGNTYCHPDSNSLAWDHPRVCGEHAFLRG